MNKQNLDRIILGILAIAVVVLFILHFTGQGKKSAQDQTLTDGSKPKTESEIKVAYVFVDSVLSNYEYYKVLTDKLLSTKASLERELAGKGESFQKEVSDFQYKVDKRLITSWDADTKQKQLTEKQQVLMNLQNDMQTRLMQDEQAVTLQLHDSMMVAVNDVNRKLGYNIILSNTFGGGLLYADDYMNITKQVLDRLNETYNKYLGNK